MALSQDSLYPATNYKIDGKWYLCYEFPNPATNVVYSLYEYQNLLAIQLELSNLVTIQGNVITKKDELVLYNKKKRIKKGFVIAGIFLDTVLKSFIGGYFYKTFK
jgi:hypothetical protein